MKNFFWCMTIIFWSFSITHAMHTGKNPDKTRTSSVIIPPVSPTTARSMQAIEPDSLFCSPKRNSDKKRATAGWVFKTYFNQELNQNK